MFCIKHFMLGSLSGSSDAVQLAPRQFRQLQCEHERW